MALSASISIVPWFVVFLMGVSARRCVRFAPVMHLLFAICVRSSDSYIRYACPRVGMPTITMGFRSACVAARLCNRCRALLHGPRLMARLPKPPNWHEQSRGCSVRVPMLIRFAHGVVTQQTTPGRLQELRSACNFRQGPPRLPPPALRARLEGSHPVSCLAPWCVSLAVPLAVVAVEEFASVALFGPRARACKYACAIWPRRYPTCPCHRV